MGGLPRDDGRGEKRGEPITDGDAPHPFYSKILFSVRGLVRSIFNGFGRILSPAQKEMFLSVEVEPCTSDFTMFRLR